MFPLPPRPNLEQYRKLAKDLQRACKSGDPAAVRQWAARLVEGRPDIPAEMVAQHWARLQKSNASAARCALAGAQFFLARAHGFANWSKFAGHIAERFRSAR